MNIRQTIDSAGFLFLRKWRPELTTAQAAHLIGIAVEIESFLPATGIPNVQLLSPKRQENAPANHYSGSFGLEEFPLHSDLAHWSIPPRYFVLRCLHGSPTAYTNLLPVSSIFSAIPEQYMRKAVFIPRKRSPAGHCCPLPMWFRQKRDTGVRWDSLFLTPLNSSAKKVAHVFSTEKWSNSLKAVNLLEPGDTLIVDNWHMLHGRSAVDDNSIDRRIERAYLSAIKG